MTAHNHSTRTPGCYRCELGEDEVRAQQTNPVHSEAVRRKVEDLCHEIGLLRQQLTEARETNTRLNRRITLAESQVRTTIEDCRRQGVSLGRGLANAGYLAIEAERDKLKDELRLTDGDLYVAVQEVRRLRDAVELVRKIHRPVQNTVLSGKRKTCIRCLAAYPCRTIAALDGAE